MNADKSPLAAHIGKEAPQKSITPPFSHVHKHKSSQISQTSRTAARLARIHVETTYRVQIFRTHNRADLPDLCCRGIFRRAIRSDKRPTVRQTHFRIANRCEAFRRPCRSHSPSIPNTKWKRTEAVADMPNMISRVLGTNGVEGASSAFACISYSLIS